MTDTPSTVLSHLFSPIRLGEVELRNRIVTTAHSTGISDGNAIGNQLIAYYEARAKGGVGLIITGSTSVHPTSTSRLLPALANWDDSVIGPYRRLAEAVHGHGARLFVQLNHAGGQSGAPRFSGPLLAPSAVRTELAGEIPHALEIGQIEEIVSAYAAAAVRVRKGGLDGVEIHAGHGNLIQQFLSPLTNRRHDGFGGDEQRRTRFARHVAEAVRQAVGADFVVGMRISAQEDFEGGLSLDDMIRIAPVMIAAGALDYVNVSSGSDSWTRSLARHYAPSYVPRQHMRPLARVIRDAVDVPVLAVGRIVDPREADRMIAAGDADLVGMTRALIADRDLPAKASKGAFDDIRLCVGANEGCIGRLMRGRSITCVYDPTSGRETILGDPEQAKNPGHMVVVGGGVAGLEAAHVASVRGHRVTLLERRSDLGGQVRTACRAPGRSEIGFIADYLVRQVRNTGTEILCGREATASNVLALRPDAVIVATGSVADDPDPSGRIAMIQARSVLEGAPVGHRILVFDTQGDMVGLTTADWLAERGHAVTLVTPHRVPAQSVEIMTGRMLRQRLAEGGVTVITETELDVAADSAPILRERMTGAETALKGIDTFVAACGGRAEDAVYSVLREAAPDLPVRLVGDAAAPRDIERAIYEGHMAGRML